MAIKTVINRACKLLIRGSDDSILYTAEEEPKGEAVEEQVAHEIKEEANVKQLDFEDVEEEDKMMSMSPLSEAHSEENEDGPEF
jgi:recombination protein RecT